MIPEESKNLVLDESAKTVKITLNPRLYPQTVVMRAAYRFTDDFDVIVDGDPLSSIFVTLKVKAEDVESTTRKDLEQLENAFFSELIHANVEETQSRRYADTRNALIGAALRNLMVQATPEKIENIGKKQKTTDEESAFDKIYKYMPKQNCGKCGADCEKTAKKILTGAANPNTCFHLKRAEFSVVREGLENALIALKNNNDCYELNKKDEKC
ncbi:MAG: (Fe-S)-binding protein [Nanoarchaeota archaeon]|nr:hypothetical protein [Nanoarchaeota archaeon]MBU4300498.1 hypothetical protein [Nanoarchaeota archaeon]MBU4451978.1 hypothetical protein [Nanoarchaeota archaeon]MCG2724138.1 hypothetical protein [archaeon]